jgi:hypothetical protein
MPAMADAISGTLTASFKDFTSFGVPRVDLKLALQCTLVCPTTAPTLHYSVAGLVNAYFSAAPTESAGYVTVGFASNVDPTGTSETVSEAFSAGSTFYVEAKSATCYCGGRIGEGGYITLTSRPVTIPVTFSTPTGVKAGIEDFVIFNAKLRGTETVEVTLSGAGVSQTKTFTQQDLGTQNSASMNFTPTLPEMMTATATLRPSGVMSSASWMVAPGRPVTGSGGGSSSGSGGGSAGGDAPPKQGCSSVAAPFLASLGLWMARRRRGAGFLGL